MNTTPPHFTPAISIAISMYNVEKYIGACLESILNQTFQDFEVIVVDNGSTDGSTAILESYVPKFGGRLKVSRSEKNSGGPNYGRAASFTRGKYVLMMDSDDLILQNALETLYRFSEEFDLEVVMPDRAFTILANAENPSEQKVVVAPRHQGTIIEAPTFETDDIAERIRKFSRLEYAIPYWSYFVKRDFLLEHEITFPKMKTGQDWMWTLQVIYFAKRFMRIPQPLYFYRINPTSVTHSVRSDEDTIAFHELTNAQGIKAFTDFFSGKKLFDADPQLAWEVLETFNRITFQEMFRRPLNLKRSDVYKISKQELSEHFGELGTLIAYFSSALHLSQFREALANQRALELEKQLKQIQGS